MDAYALAAVSPGELGQSLQNANRSGVGEGDLLQVVRQLVDGVLRILRECRVAGDPFCVDHRHAVGEGNGKLLPSHNLCRLPG